MHKRTKSFVSVLMAALMIAGLCSCAKEAPEKEEFGNQLDGLEKVRLEHVYTVSYIDLPETETVPTEPEPDPDKGEWAYSDEYINSISEANGKIYIVKQYYNERYANEEYFSDNGIRVYSLDPDGKNYRVAAEFKTENRNSENSFYYSGIDRIVPCPDGSFWYSLREEENDWSDPNEYKYSTSSYLVHTAEDGTELARLTMSDIIEDMPDYMYISNFFLSASGDLIVHADSAVYVIGQDGVLKKTVPISTSGNMWVNSITSTGSGDIICLVIDYENNKRTINRVDTDAGELKEICEMPFADSYSLIGGPGTTILSNVGSSLYSYDYVSGRQQELINWLNSDINSNRINNVTPLSDGRFIVMEYSRDYGNSRLAFLTPAADGEAVEKYVISYASVYLDDALQDAIIEYNKQNGDFRIQFVDYSLYNTDEDYSGGIKQLNLDIISGKIPDIISLEGLPFQTYASKGLLADIGALMDADPDFSREDYLENILTAPSFKGRSYSVIPSFYIMTVVGKSEFVGSKPGWTIDDLRALTEAHPDSAVFDNMTKTDILNYIMNMAIDKYIDYDSGSCSFNSDSFVKTLELVNSFPETIDWEKVYGSMTEADWRQRDSMYREGRTLLNVAYVSSYDDIKSQMNNFGGDITYIGFPVPEGIGSVIMPNMEIAVSSKSKLKGACWDFIRYILSDDFINEFSYAFPVKRSVLEQRMADAMDPERYGGGGPILYKEAAEADVLYPEDPDDYWSKPVTQEQADKINELVSTVSSVYRSNEDVMAIIEEEAGAYFSGQKSVQTVADIIQSRAQIYVSENM